MSARPERVVAAMSGGVDSSVAAALAAEQGAEVIGVTLHLAGSRSRCCSLADADDARRVAERLGIRFFVANYRERFEREVKQAFADAYLAGRTPIPCVPCNSRFKFDYLLERARVFGADRVVSGHYARSDRDPASGRLRLRRAVDADKDQTYFLFELTQEQLAAVRFPLGDMAKEDVRARARELGLGTADKPESQEICFVPDGDYARAVEAIRPEALPGAGDVVDGAGRVLGRHDGVHRFTVGQRRGLGIAAERPLTICRGEVEQVLEPLRLATTFSPVPGGRRLRRALSIVALYPWSWLVRPHAGEMRSFSAWRRGIREPAGVRSASPTP